MANKGTRYITNPDVIPVVAEGASAERTLSERASDIVNVRDYGATGDGTTDDNSSIIAAQTVAQGAEKILFTPAGQYNRSGTIYSVDSDSLWLNRDFSSGVNSTASARTTPLLVTVETPDETPLDGQYSRVGISMTSVARGSQHADCIRGNLNNYSDDGAGNTAFYGRASSTPSANWSAAQHGETRHDGGTTLCLSAEAAIYSSTGNPYGLVINNTTKSAEDTHPLTGAAKAKNVNATGIYVQGSSDYDSDEKSAWAYGLRFGSSSIRSDGATLQVDSPAGHGIYFSTSAVNSTADIRLTGDSAYGILLSGTYTSGIALRVKGGQAISYESTGAIKSVYESGQLKFKNATNDRIAFELDATPRVLLNGLGVLGERQAAIPDATAGTEVETLNAILAAMRAHGLIAT